MAEFPIVVMKSKDLSLATLTADRIYPCLALKNAQGCHFGWVTSTDAFPSPEQPALWLASQTLRVPFEHWRCVQKLSLVSFGELPAMYPTMLKTHMLLLLSQGQSS